MTHAEQAATLLARIEDSGPGSSGGRKLEERHMLAVAAVAHAVLAAVETIADQTTATLVQHANDARSVCDALAAGRMALESMTVQIAEDGADTVLELRKLRDAIEEGHD